MKNKKAIIRISSAASGGDLTSLKTALITGLNAGLTINQSKEVLVHIYAYAGFPRSIRSLQTLMAVLDERKANGIQDTDGVEASPVKTQGSKYERGKAILQKLTGVVESGKKTGYAAFAPVIETFLKEHLFADIFERDVLSYIDRELVTISVLTSLGGLEPMLASHLSICLNLGVTPDMLHEFTSTIEPTISRQDVKAARSVLAQVLKQTAPAEASPFNSENIDMIFPRGGRINNANFTGTAYLQMLSDADSLNPISIGNVTFEAGARTKWHKHPAGQILLVTDGIGFYQEQGKKKQILKKGDVIKCPENLAHWHGASDGTSFVQIAITSRHKGETEWLHPVSDKEYRE